MERIFIEDVKTVGGDVKFPAGVVRDLPKDTWQRIAASAGRPLDEITALTTDLAKANVSAARPMIEKARPKKQVQTGDVGHADQPITRRKLKE